MVAHCLSHKAPLSGAGVSLAVGEGHRDTGMACPLCLSSRVNFVICLLFQLFDYTADLFSFVSQTIADNKKPSRAKGLSGPLCGITEQRTGMTIIASLIVFPRSVKGPRGVAGRSDSTVFRGRHSM